MIFKTEYKPTGYELSQLPEEEIIKVVNRSASEKLSDFILTKHTPKKDEATGIYKTELFVTKKEDWIKLRKLINLYGGAELPYELESLLLAMEQQ